MKDKGVTLIRCISTVMILLCHLFGKLGVPMLPVFLNVGVQYFFIISGMLYADKKNRKHADLLYKQDRENLCSFIHSAVSEYRHKWQQKYSPVFL